MTRGRRRGAALGVCVLPALALGACGGSGITPGALESSIGPAFANLYVRQQAEQGHPRPTTDDLQARALCQKGTPADPQSGAGDDWTCRITFLVAGPATPVVATYTVTVQADGCYAAEGDGPASVNGTRTITGPGGEQRVNPLRLIDGCFELRA